MSSSHHAYLERILVDVNVAMAGKTRPERLRTMERKEELGFLTIFGKDFQAAADVNAPTGDSPLAWDPG